MMALLNATIDSPCFGITLGMPRHALHTQLKQPSKLAASINVQLHPKA